jgi:hypothetical protein
LNKRFIPSQSHKQSQSSKGVVSSKIIALVYFYHLVFQKMLSLRPAFFLVFREGESLGAQNNCYVLSLSRRAWCEIHQPQAVR